MDLWEILVPTISNEGKPYRTRYHRVWDAKVRAITGGLTIMAPAKGQWKSLDGDLYIERMIPVRIACTREQIEEIIDITMKYYDQLAVMAYRVSDEVIIKNRIVMCEDCDNPADLPSKLCVGCDAYREHTGQI